MNGSELLALYRKTGSETAFSDLVRRYANLVYSIARRRLSDQSLAEDVAQTVFTRLAQTPPKTRSEGELAAWLHRTTLHVSIDAWRSETRRRNREQKAVLMETASAEDARLWEEMTPCLDEALNQLSDDDRQAMLLRFFERKAMRDVGLALGVSEDAAKMRVSRAVHRLRDQFARRGIVCTAVLLVTILGAHSVEAAPSGLLAKLLAIKLSAPAVGASSGAVLGLLQSRVVWITSAVFVATMAVLILSNRQTQPAPRSDGLIAESETSRTPSETRMVSVSRPSPSVARAPLPIEPTARFIVRVVDRETGVGLPGAKIHAPYFYAGGVGESHDLETDSDGNAPIPERNHPERLAGMNLFVRAEGYVPIAISLHGGDAMTNRTIELEPALSVGGTVVDEQGQPVPGVELQAQRDDSDVFKGGEPTYKRGAPNTDFQLSKVRTDPDGRWLFPYVPKNYNTIGFQLTCSNYAVTRVSVPVGQPESLNATLVIERGYAVAGQVLDSAGRPVAGATVREYHNFGYRKLSTRTDENGFFVMQGLKMPRRMLVGFRDPLHPKAEWTEPEQKIQIIAEAEGKALQEQTILLANPTNVVDFTLAPGSVFRGRVVDEAGNPVPGAAVRTDFDFQNQIEDPYEWLAHTDEAGRFEWDSAPAKPVCFWFEADGYEVIRSLSIVPDGTDHEISLRRTTRTATTR